MQIALPAVVTLLISEFMRKKKWMNLAAIALAGAMFATGCGSSAGSAAQATTQAAQTESSAEETAAQENLHYSLSNMRRYY